MREMRDWKLKDRLEAGAYAAVILAVLAASVIFVSNARSTAIAGNRSAIARAWTNEGDALSNETRFIDLTLEDRDGDIIGTLSSPPLEAPLDVRVAVGWFSSQLTVTQVRGRSIAPIATAEVKITGNHNRLSWRVTSGEDLAYLPRETTLWPNVSAQPQ